MIHTAIAGFYYFYFSFIGVNVIFFPKVLSLIGYSDIELSIIMAAAPLVRFVSPFIFGNRIHLTRKIFQIALFSVLISSILMYLAIDDFYALFISAVALGFAMSLVLPYVELMALEYIDKAVYGKVRLFGSVGFVVVALVLKEFMDNPYHSLYFFMGIGVLILLFGLWTLKLVTQELGTKSTTTQTAPFKLRNYTYLWISLFLMQLAFMPFYNFFTIYETALGISLTTTVYLWIAGVLFEIVMLYYQGIFFKRFTLIDMLIFSTFVTAIRWGLVYFFPTNIGVLYFAQSLHAFSFALYHSVAIRLLFELYDQPKVAQQFFSGLSYGLGAFLGSIIAGFIYDYNPSIVFLYAALMTLLATYLLILQRKTITL
jgi:PPP family 3-phenylpropionic acid transporter